MSDPPHRDDFAALLQRTLEGAGETRPIRYDQERFALRIGDNGELCFNLENVYAEYCQAAPEQREQLLLRVPGFVPYQPHIPDDFEQVRELLLPRVRERIFYELHRMRLEVEGESGVEFPHRLIAQDLACGLCVDLPESVVEFGRERFALWEIDFESALELATENLRQRSQEPFEQAAPGLWISPWRDSHDATRLILTDVIGRLEVNGAPVCMAPNRDVLLVSGSDDRDGLLALAAVAQRVLSDPRPMSSIPLVLGERGWETFAPLPELGEQVQRVLGELSVLARARDYSEQRQLLTTMHEQRGLDLYVSELTVARFGQGDVTSFCTWAPGVRALLPRADRVVFIGEDQQPLGQVPWEQVEASFAALLRPRDDLFPPRYEVDGFPESEPLQGLLEPFPPVDTQSEEALESLRAQAGDDPEAALSLAMLTARLAASAAQVGDIERAAALFGESAEQLEGRLAAGNLEIRPHLAEVLVQRGTLLRPLGRSADAAEALERAELLLGDMVDAGEEAHAEALARARLSRARLHYDMDALPQALELVERALAAAPITGGWQVEAGMLHADLLRLRCRYAEARQVLDATVAAAADLGDERQLIEVLLTLLRGSVAHDQGYDGEALQHLEDAEARLNGSEHAQLLAKLPMLRGLTLLDARVDMPSALEAFGQTMTRLEALANQGAPVTEEVCEARVHRGRCLIRAQQAEPGLAELDAVIPTLEQLVDAGSRDSELVLAQAKRDRALALLVLDRNDEAEALCRAALDVFEARLDLGAGADVDSFTAQTRARLATCLLRQDKLEPARYAFMGAVRVFEKLVQAGRGLDVKDLARAYIGYADTLRRLGESEPAREQALKVPQILAHAEGPAIEPILNAASSLLTIIK
jgi:tetratricopeptide (TPR) repeat protein